MTNNKWLASLNLAHNRIADEGVRYLGDTLESRNCKLASLDLSCNEITDQGVGFLCDLFKSKNCELTFFLEKRQCSSAIRETDI